MSDGAVPPVAVAIRWRDAYVLAGGPFGRCCAAEQELMELFCVGLVVAEYPDRVVVAAEWAAEEDTFLDLRAIPRSCIVDMHYFNVVQRVDEHPLDRLERRLTQVIDEEERNDYRAPTAPEGAGTGRTEPLRDGAWWQRRGDSDESGRRLGLGPVVAGGGPPNPQDSGEAVLGGVGGGPAVPDVGAGG